ncbi:MAG: hypothetical protein ACRDFT_01695 [bacterium]
MSPQSPREDIPAMRERADHLREAIASRAGRLRRDAARMVPRMVTGLPRRERASARRLPSWAVAAAVGAIAGLLAAVRRRRSKP